jgi:HSP20 family protein
MELTRFNNLYDFPTVMLSLNDTVNRLIAGDNQVRPWSPAVDIFETDNELIFRADTPDVNLEHIEVQVENGTLTLKGERGIEKDDRVNGYHRIERSYGAFARSFTLPETVDTEDVRADYAHGF